VSKNRNIDQAFLDVYMDIKIKYPFCYKDKSNRNYFRYLEDGRYEYICLEPYKATLSFGSRAGSIDYLLEEDGFYFKILANLNEVITNEEFEIRREEYLKEYDKYLAGDKYINAQVKDIIRRKNESTYVPVENVSEAIQSSSLNYQSGDIIIGPEPTF
jgi:hypothetical protein